MSDAPDRRLRSVEQPAPTPAEEMRDLNRRVTAWDQDTEISRVLAKAGRWRLGYLGALALEEEGNSIRRLANEVGMSNPYLGRLVRVWKDHGAALGQHLIDLIQKPRSEGLAPDACSELAQLPDIQELYVEVRDTPKKKEETMGTPAVVALDGIRRLGPGKLPVPSAGTQRERIASEFIVAGPDGLTDDEIIVSGVANHQSAGGRRSELEKMGIVYATDTYRTTRSGKKATVFALTPDAARQAGLSDYDAPPKKKKRASTSRGGTGTSTRRRTPKSQLRPSPEEEAEQQRRNYLHECRMTVYRAVMTFKGADAPDPNEFGSFLADGSPGFGPFELQKTVQYLQKVSVVYSQERGIDPDMKGAES
jgi:hypothetical protein